MLRDYQGRAIDGIRNILYTPGAHSGLIQLPTGAGKTAIVAEIIRSVFQHNRRAWFVVPRNELLQQGSEHLTKWGVPHGLISAGREESRAYLVHVVSKDTLLRRLERIKNWPDLLVFDEAHIAYAAQLKIIAMLPETTKIIGVSATPERLSGEGLSDIYDGIYYGPSIPWLTAAGFLSPMRYFAPPIDGLENIHRKGTEYDADELEVLLEKHRVYGDVIGYYEKYGTVKQIAISLPGQAIIKTNQNYNKGKPALIFCRSVKSAYETAERFQKAGFQFFCIEGDMPAAKRKALIEGMKLGKIDGLTNCDLCTYGLDIPRVEYGASIRPTLSRALYFQKVGRIIRPYEDRQTGYRKEEALFFDHANLVQEHQDPEYPGVPLFYLDKINWNFNGNEKRRHQKPDTETMRLCPHLDYQYCNKVSCAGCSLLAAGEDDGRRATQKAVDVDLEERKGPTKYIDLLPEEKQSVQDRIGRATDAALADLALGKVETGPIAELLKIAEELDRKSIWVYWHLTEKENKARKDAGKDELRTVNVQLLHEISRIKGYKNGWAWFMQKEIQKGIIEKEQQEEALI